MSFDIEKRFRFVSSDDINDDVKESDYIEEDINNSGEEDGENIGKVKKEKKEVLPESGFDDIEKDKIDLLEEEEDEEEDE